MTESTEPKPVKKVAATKPVAKTPVKTPAKATKPIEKETPKFKPSYTTLLDAVEKKFALSNAGLDSKARETSLFSSGLLCTDLILDGGILPGAWYTLFGAEQSSKSTHMMHILQAALSTDVPILNYFDAEGSLANSPDYFEAMLNGVGKHKYTMSDIFGVRDKNGKWVKEAKARLYPESSIEGFFNSMGSLLRNLPDKQFLNDKWFYVYENTKNNKALVGDFYSKTLFSKYNKFYVEAENGQPQAIIFLDSYPAMLPDGMDDDDSSSGMAAVARSISANINKVAGKIKRKGVTIIGVNQLRLRPGTIYGSPEYEPCFIGSTKVLLADGSIDTIENIVLGRKDVEVMSFDPKTGVVSAKRVIDWKNNGLKSVSELVKLTYVGLINNVESELSIVCTKNHKIWTENGWKEVGSLTTDTTIYLDNKTEMKPTKVVSISEPVIYDDFACVYDLTVEDNHTYFVVGDTNDLATDSEVTTTTNFINRGIAVSNCGEALKFNSSVRLKQTARAIPHDKGQIEKERSVVNPDGFDTYRYIHAKAIKNKLSPPLRESFYRIWVSDSDGQAHGFCPVWDAFEYLKATGQVEGTMKKMSLSLEDISIPKMTFLDLKGLILLSGTALKEHCEKLGLDKNPKIRERCFQQLKSGVASNKYNAVLSGGRLKEEDLEDDDVVDDDGYEDEDDDD